MQTEANTQDGPVDMDRLESAFFEALGQTAPELASVDRSRVLDAVDTPVDSIIELVDAFDDALANEVSVTEIDIERQGRRHAVVSGLAAVCQMMVGADESFCQTVVDVTGTEPPAVPELRGGATVLADLFGSVVEETDTGVDSAVARHRQEGEEHFNAESYWQAAQSFRKVLLIVPDDADAYAGLGASMMQFIHTLSLARHHLEQALELNPTHVRANTYYPQVRWQLDGEEAGSQAFEDALEQLPEQRQIYNLYISGLRQEGEHDTVEEVYERGITAVEDDHILRRQYAKYLTRREKHDRAREQYEQAIDDDRAGPLVYIWFGVFQDMRGFPDTAREHLRTGFEMIASDVETESGTIDIDIDSYMPSLAKLVTLLSEAGEDDAVVRWCEFGLDHRDAVTEHTDSLDVLEQMLDTYRESVEDEDEDVGEDEDENETDKLDMVSSKTDDATVESQAAAAVDVDAAGVTDPDTLATVGDTYRKTGVYELAVAYFERALELVSDHVDAHLGLARVAKAREPTDEETARHHFRRAIELDPDSHEVRYWYAMALADWGDRGPAETQFEAALDIVPEDVWTKLQYGSYCYDWGANDDARRHLEAGLTAAKHSSEVGVPTQLTSITSLVDICERAGDIEAVRDWCEYGLSLCDDETFRTMDEPEQLETTLEQYADSVPTPWKRSDEPTSEQYWYLSVNGQEANIVVSANGKVIASSSNEGAYGGSFAGMYPISEHVDATSYEIEVTVLRAIVEDSFENTRYLSGPEDISVTATVKTYAEGDIASTHDQNSVTTATCDPKADETLPQTMTLSVDTTDES